MSQNLEFRIRVDFEDGNSLTTERSTYQSAPDAMVALNTRLDAFMAAAMSHGISVSRIVGISVQVPKPEEKEEKKEIPVVLEGFKFGKAPTRVTKKQLEKRAETDRINGIVASQMDQQARVRGFESHADLVAHQAAVRAKEVDERLAKEGSKNTAEELTPILEGK